MKEYEFRGRVADEPNEWVYGKLIPTKSSSEYPLIKQEQEKSYNKCCGFGTFSVRPESLGRYTGFRDIHKVKIYEKDIVKHNNRYYTVEYSYVDNEFTLVSDQNTMLLDYRINDLEVVGNSYRVL